MESLIYIAITNQYSAIVLYCDQFSTNTFNKHDVACPWKWFDSDVSNQHQGLHGDITIYTILIIVA